MRFSSRTIGDRMGNAVKRVTIEQTNEQPLFRESEVSLYAQEKQKEIEHFEPYGFTSRVKPPSGSGQDKNKAEGLMVFTGGNRSHGILFMSGDRRFRVKELKEGELALFDDQGQQVHFTRDGIVMSVPKGKKITTQVMKSDQAPKAQSSGQQTAGVAARDAGTGSGGSSSASSSSQFGQAPQANPDQEVYTSHTLSAEALTFTHPDKLVFKVGSSTLTMLPNSIEINSPTVSGVVSTRFETVGKTYLGVDSKGDSANVLPVKLIDDSPAKQTYAKKP